MKEIEITNLIINGTFGGGIKVGLAKAEIEQIISRPLGAAVIETPDVSCYFIEAEPGYYLLISLDKGNICFEINFSFDENRDFEFVIFAAGKLEVLSSIISFEHLVGLLLKLDLEWTFDTKRTYLQTVCINLRNKLRLYYAFGSNNDFGFFSIKSVLENHSLFS